jgi:periplasmic divalent cation tolerance protein
MTTTNSEEEAERLAQTLISEKLAACVNIIPAVTSVYRWEGQIQRDQEWLLIAKSRADLLDQVVQRLQVIHSYDLPEIIAVPLTGGSEAYLRWIDREVLHRAS